MSLTSPAILEASTLVSWGPSNPSHTFPPGLPLEFRETLCILSNNRERGPSLIGSALCSCSPESLTGTARCLALQSTGSVQTALQNSDAYGGHCRMSCPGLELHSRPFEALCLTSHTRLARLLPPHLQGSFSPPLKETALRYHL